MEPKRVAILGAGVSGLAAIKSCLEGGLSVVCYEKLDDLGGMWRYRDSSEKGIGSVARSTVTNTSKEFSAFSDFPPPAEYPNYVHNELLLQYFDLYAQRFNLKDHIKYKHEVIRVEQSRSYETTGRWLLTVENKGNIGQEEFDGVMVCTGRFSHPVVPRLEGLDKFQGRIIHTHRYKVPDEFLNQRVLVVGAGNSAVDAAVELGPVSQKVYLSTRTGFWVLQRVGTDGLPFDLSFSRLTFAIFGHLPRFLRGFIFKRLADRNLNHDIYRVKPERLIFGQNSIINDVLANSVLCGRTVIKGDVKYFTNNGVVFEGEEGHIHEIDAVILGTGYEMGFPYLQEEVLGQRATSHSLYKHVFPPKLPHLTLAFIGMLQAFGSLFPISEMQSRWFVQLMTGNLPPPSEELMRQDVQKSREELDRIFPTGRKAEFRISYVAYMDSLALEFGARPNLSKLIYSDPELFWKILCGPILSYQYRLVGPNAWPGARDAIMKCQERILKPFETRKSSGGASGKVFSFKNLAKFVTISAVSVFITVYYY